MSSDGAFLDAAWAIGREIVDDAVWHDGRCTWIGATGDPKQPWRLKYRALGPRVYEGSAGVGLFLAQLALVTREPGPRRTAVGALRHALAGAPALPTADRGGLYAGVMGVALAAARVATWLDEPELDAGASTLVASGPPAGGRCPDVLSGTAGVVIGLLALRDRCSVETAVGLGDDLLARGRATEHGLSWASPGDRRHVCGLSHGAAGIGWALAELSAASGEERFGDGAARAFAYERSWLDPESGMWPDLRVPGQRRGRPPAPGTATTGTWCRGEAGIAQTRRRAAALTGAEAERRDAERALATTRSHVSGLCAREIEDLSLCHGAAGSADILLNGSEESPEAVALGRHTLERHGGGPWPGGVRGGVTPGLFLGLSGIAWWFLRLHDARIPSPLETWG
jgi:lantibiotic modifying enzyme